MDTITFNRAAFKHGVAEAEIVRAFETFVFESAFENEDNKYPDFDS